MHDPVEVFKMHGPVPIFDREQNSRPNVVTIYYTHDSPTQWTICFTCGTGGCSHQTGKSGSLAELAACQDQNDYPV